MPIHDWSRVTAGDFHHFHGRWIYALGHVLNFGLLPSDCYALAEQRSGATEPDVLMLETKEGVPDETGAAADFDIGRGTAVLDVEPKVSVQADGEADTWAATRQRSLAIRHVSGNRILAMIEIVSPGNKDRPLARRRFVNKCLDHLEAGVHVVVLDVLPSARGGPSLGIEVWAEASAVPPDLPQDRPLVQTSICMRDGAPHLYAEPAAVDQVLPSLPLFYEPEWYVTLPLEETYMTAWEDIPRPVRRQML